MRQRAQRDGAFYRGCVDIQETREGKYQFPLRLTKETLTRRNTTLEVSTTEPPFCRLMTAKQKVLIAKSSDGYIAKRENEPGQYEIDSQAFADLQKAAADLKPTTEASK